jgi:hypothetical protein
LSEPFGTPSNLAVHFRDLNQVFDPCLSADGAKLLFGTTGSLNAPNIFADIWQIPLLKLQPPQLSIRLTKSTAR